MEQQQTLYQVRTKICKFCASYNQVMDTCQQTEKIIKIYAERLNNKCPLNRWPQ
jgi:hypothetical protein